MKKWRLSLIAITLLISFTIGGVAVSAATYAETVNEPLKVFVGSKSKEDVSSRSTQVNERTQFIMQKSVVAPEEEELALITFDKYLTAKEADVFINSLTNCEVKEIFLGIPNIDGRTIIGKEGTGTIEERVFMNFNEMIETEENLDAKQILLEYKNKSKVFALTVKTNNAQIAKICQMDNVDFVDTYNYPEAEQTALNRNISVSYIAVPEKPDNSH